MHLTLKRCLISDVETMIALNARLEESMNEIFLMTDR